MNIRKKIAIVFTLIALITALIISFIIIPTIRDIKKISDAVRIERVDLEKKYQRGQLLRTIIKDFEKIKPDQNLLASVFIIDGKELNFITALEQIAIQTGVSQTIQLSTEQSTKQKTVASLPLNLATSGTFSQTIAYLQKLEQLNYYFIVTGFKMYKTSAAESPTDPTIAMNLNGMVFLLPDESTITTQ